MLKGIYKEFITVKISENPLYEEAIFILKHPASDKKQNKDMIFEANRILCEKGIKPLKAKRKILFFLIFPLFSLIFGIFLGILLTFLF